MPKSVPFFADAHAGDTKLNLESRLKEKDPPLLDISASHSDHM
jgi:hypothetical protein